jgi:hypothetical protein
MSSVYNQKISLQKKYQDHGWIVVVSNPICAIGWLLGMETSMPLVNAMQNRAGWMLGFQIDASSRSSGTWKTSH